MPFFNRTKKGCSLALTKTKRKPDANPVEAGTSEKVACILQFV
jgi:hypothetical protein